MNKTINVLILDDNELVVECLTEKFLTTNQLFCEMTNINIVPYYLKIDLIEGAVQIEEYLIKNSIHYLLLDRGFITIYDPENISNSKLNKDKLYISKSEKSIKINEILKKVNFNKIKKLDGAILYTYDEPEATSEWYVKPETIKQDLKNIIGNKVDKENIEVILTNSEIYKYANYRLFDLQQEKTDDRYIILGEKADFKLYGLFLGEILYHRVLKFVNKKHQIFIKARKTNINRKVLLLFIIMSSLTIGANSLYGIVSRYIDNNVIVCLSSLIFSLILPIIILFVKPEWIIDIE
ncbi:MAG: hypothetical protein ISS81_10720 [Candidatus Marinimicrobia bacterium]|nr:hypothetical protein [Candidatus Neomarinimicrobiota bacterium]